MPDKGTAGAAHALILAVIGGVIVGAIALAVKLLIWGL